jgi:hypothetical protein
VNEPLGLRPSLDTPPGLKPLLIFFGIVVAFSVVLVLVLATSTHEVEHNRLSPDAYCTAMNSGQDPSVHPGIDCAGA